MATVAGHCLFYDNLEKCNEILLRNYELVWTQTTRVIIGWSFTKILLRNYELVRTQTTWVIIGWSFTKFTFYVDQKSNPRRTQLQLPRWCNASMFNLIVVDHGLIPLSNYEKTIQCCTGFAVIKLLKRFCVLVPKNLQSEQLICWIQHVLIECLCEYDTSSTEIVLKRFMTVRPDVSIFHNRTGDINKSACPWIKLL